jgi:hypothetical protein
MRSNYYITIIFLIFIIVIELLQTFNYINHDKFISILIVTSFVYITFLLHELLHVNYKNQQTIKELNNNNQLSNLLNYIHNVNTQGKDYCIIFHMTASTFLYEIYTDLQKKPILIYKSEIFENVAGNDTFYEIINIDIKSNMETLNSDLKL